MIERAPQDPLGLDGKTYEELLALATNAGIRCGELLSREKLIRQLAEVRLGPPEPTAPGVSQSSGKASPSESTPQVASDATTHSRIPAELPHRYGTTRLTLMEVDPFHLFAYWEITPQDRDWALKHVSAPSGSSSWVLRLYDVSCIEFDGTNAHGSFDVPIDPTSASWYIDLWSDEKTYLAELGIRSPEGQFVAICRSNFVQTPRSSSSPRYQPCWMRVDYQSNSGSLVNPGPYTPAAGSEKVSDLSEVSTNPQTPVAPSVPGEDRPTASPREVQETGAMVHSERGSESRGRARDGLGMGAEERVRPAPSAAPESDPLVAEVDAAIGRSTSPADSSKGSLPSSSGFSSVATEICTLLRRSESPAPRAEHPTHPGDAGGPVPGAPTSALRVTATDTFDDEGPVLETPEPPITDEQVKAHYARPLTPEGPASPLGIEAPPSATGDCPSSPHEGSVSPHSFLLPGDRAAGPGAPPRPPPGGPSSYGLSSGHSGPQDAPSLSLQLACEVIVHGRALPGQTLEVNGHWVRVNPDGTFRVQWALSTT